MTPSSNESYKMELTNINRQWSSEDLLNDLVSAMKFKKRRQGNRRVLVETEEFLSKQTLNNKNNNLLLVNDSQSLL